MRKLRISGWVLALVVMGGLSGAATAQPNDAPSGPPSAPTHQRGGWRGMNWQRMQERMLNRIKDELKVSDAIWTVLKPKVQAVQELQFQARMARFMGGRFRGRGGPAMANLTDNSAVAAAQALAATLRDPNATAAQIEAKLTALRQARRQAADKLKAAEDDLRQLLSVRQEAVLVEQGLLD